MAPASLLQCVSPTGGRWLVPRHEARQFASKMVLNEKVVQNFATCMDENEREHHFCDGWQGIYNLRWFEAVDKDGNIVAAYPMVGTLKQFYERVVVSHLGINVSWAYFRQTAAPTTKKKLLGWRVATWPTRDSEVALPLGVIPDFVVALDVQVSTTLHV